MEIPASQLVEISKLRAHSKNYRKHPKAQLDHIQRSIVEQGFYRNVVVSQDMTILAGHGIVEAAKRLGMKRIPVVTLPIAGDSKRAMRLIVGDNEIGGMAESDETKLAALLREVSTGDIAELVGTGFDDQSYATLMMLVGQTQGNDPDAEWKGMPTFNQRDMSAKRSIIVHFKADKDVEKFVKALKIKVTPKTKFIWFPMEPNIDSSAVAIGGRKN